MTRVCQDHKFLSGIKHLGPSTSTIDENINKIEAHVLVNHRLTQRDLVDIVGV